MTNFLGRISQLFPRVVGLFPTLGVGPGRPPWWFPLKGKKVLPGVFFGKGEEQGVGRSLVPWKDWGVSVTVESSGFRLVNSLFPREEREDGVPDGMPV